MLSKIASVIVTYNRKELMAEALSSLLNQSHPLTKIIIIDNNSTDGTYEYLSKKKLIIDKVNYINLGQNLGGSAGFYYGIKYALNENVDWISLSDDDAILDTDYFEKLMEVANNNRAVQAFTGTVKTNNQISVRDRSYFSNSVFFSQKVYPETDYRVPFFEIDVFTFIGCLLKKELIESVGLPERDYFIWYDDVEYSLRISKKTTIVNVSNAIINHKTNVLDTNKYFPNWKEFYGLRNRLFMIQKHSSSKVKSFFVVLLYLLVKFTDSISNSKYRGYRGYRLKLLYDVLRAVFSKKKGKNDHYLPGKSLV